jgi:mono/diheme cytochrome c family protein
MKTGRPVEYPEARYEVTGKPAIVAPAALGMHNWHPMAFSPETQLVYLPVTVSSSTYATPPNFKPNMSGWNTGIGFTASAGVTPVPSSGTVPERDSYLLAWDPIAGKEVWRVRNETYGASGVLVTSGNLVFSGNHSGEFVAYDARDGRKLWSAPTQARVVAAPSTYLVDGQQQVAILVGARGLPADQKRTNALSANNSRLLVFKPGGAASLPAEMSAVVATAGVRINPPLLTANNETVASGEQLYSANCAVCHGATSVAAQGAIGPDLRYSGLLPFRAQWNGAVRDGDRAQRGMPGFAATLTEEQTDSILAYVIKRANDEKAVQEAAVAAARP